MGRHRRGSKAGNHRPVPSVADHFKVQKKPTKSKAKNPLSEEAKLKRILSRFNGMTEEEVSKRGLPDYLRDGLDIVFIGINPSLAAAYSGKYYDGPGNHFWQALHLSGKRQSMESNSHNLCGLTSSDKIPWSVLGKMRKFFPCFMRKMDKIRTNSRPRKGRD